MSSSSTGRTHRHRLHYEPISIESSSSSSPETPTPLSQLSSLRSCRCCCGSTSPSTTTTTATTAFLALGLLNNCSYVILLAAAKDLLEGGTAVVFLVDVMPGLLIKASAPYWFDSVSYQTRLVTASVVMGLAFFLVAVFSSHNSSHNNNDSDNEEEAGLSRNTAASSSSTVIWGQLLGVALISLQCGLGEASLLALAGKCDKQQQQQQQQQRRREGREGGSNTSNHNHNNHSNNTSSSSNCLTAFSAGTGLSGPVGYLWKVLLTDVLGWSLERMLLSAMGLAVAYGMIYRVYLWNVNGDCNDNNYGNVVTDDDIVVNGNNDNNISSNDDDELIEEGAETIMNGQRNNDDREDHGDMQDSAKEEETSLTKNKTCDNDNDGTMLSSLATSTNLQQQVDSSNNNAPLSLSVQQPSVMTIADMTARQRFRLVLSLWPYIVPLFTVYAAEYACQAGAWAAIGFPMTDRQARGRFYETSNWLYQVGVFVSRSSGTLLTINLPVLWCLPGLQVVNLVVFSATAIRHGLFYRPFLLYVLSLYTGLLGGAVYVHGYKRIVADVPSHYTEFALASTSVAEGLGILVADVMGLFLQSCLYQANGLSGALVQCPL